MTLRKKLAAALAAAAVAGGVSVVAAPTASAHVTCAQGTHGHGWGWWGSTWKLVASSRVNGRTLRTFAVVDNATGRTHRYESGWC